MTAKTRSETRGWVRVRLGAPANPQHSNRPTPTEGELVLRADRVAVDADRMMFIVDDEVAFELERRYFRSMAWFVDRPTFAEWLRARRAQYPNAHTPWSDLEVETLRGEVEAGADWAQIAKAHGRTSSAVKRQATYYGFASAAAPGGDA